MNHAQLATTLALAEHLCPSMNGASTDRFAAALEAVGPTGLDENRAALADGDREWVDHALGLITRSDVDRWSTTLDELQADGVHVVSCADAHYPANLRMIHNRPPLLFVRGEILPSDNRAIAVVGTRDATDAGIAAATEVSRLLVERGVTILSGLAAGIDTAAHSAALNAGGRTIAVFGTGIRGVYPHQNRRLAKTIASSAACVSQFLPDQASTRWSFAARNIVTSGLSLGTVVIEAEPTSGAKLHAYDALRHGKRLFLLRRLVESQDWARKLAELPEVQTVDGIDEIVAAAEVELGPEQALR
jgi:DNA processing protein